MYIKDHLGCYTYQTCEVAFDPLSSWNRTRNLHFGSWDRPFIPCLHVHKPMLWTVSICAECECGEKGHCHIHRGGKKGTSYVLLLTKHLLWWSGCWGPNEPPERRQSHVPSLMGIIAQPSWCKCSVALPTPTWERRSKWGYYSLLFLIDKSEVRCVVYFERPNKLVLPKNHVRIEICKTLCQVIVTYETKSITSWKATLLCAKICCMQKG